MPLAHYTQSVQGRLSLARDEQERRAVLRAVARIAGRRLLLSSLVDDHLHVALRSPHPRRLARDLRTALKPLRPALELDPPHVRPVERRAHLEWLVRYFVQQPVKHGLAGVQAALWTGSPFQDLVGARALPRYDTQTITDELPRLRQRHLFLHLGLEPEPLVPADDRALRRAGLERIVRLAGEVLAAGPDLTGRRADRVAAKTLAAVAAEAAGFGARDMALALGITPRAVRYLARRSLDPRALPALRRRLALEERLLGK